MNFPLGVLKSPEDFCEILKKSSPTLADGIVFYSSVWNQIALDPRLFVLPLDEHMVHRGDGVFEALRIVSGKVYQLDAHLQRLSASARAISLTPCEPANHISKIVEEMIKVSGLQGDAYLRIFLSRGAGTFSVNPYDTTGSQLYLVITQYKGLDSRLYDSGIQVGLSHISLKSSFWAQIKSCNYLPNVLMKKEAVDKGFFMTLSTEGDAILEGATENFAAIDNLGNFVYPPFNATLKGITLCRLKELIEENSIDLGDLKVVERRVLISEIPTLREAFLIGTTLNVLPIVKIDQQVIGNGRPGSVGVRLRKLLDLDMGLVRS